VQNLNKFLKCLVLLDATMALMSNVLLHSEHQGVVYRLFSPGLSFPHRAQNIRADTTAIEDIATNE
jgi:hypothetical protein